ncbi:MAG: 4-hydroxythreonine-4-phosphate dehydrogenase PdxA [Pigmentiphaga sp.]|uniref:4-hydroxythreonine-4-phosphate dehydrogenase PdxA n=1 Tax=Pigmentiphaga sp. TaxID=1977564 RepID=UPI0029B859D3|nr:4-hydroxythreonine-4-phosphate dehydrogenase PdxA [Pigmentiphaga sp.]MDX3904545.1 4-hydroxythreonine-4-phosphate dehydrogenase PdxA [Pigmentiphaga sp.]
MHAPRRLVLTTGEPAGIGPELSAAAAVWFARMRGGDTVPANAELVLVGDRDLLARRGGIDPSALAGVGIRHVALRVPAEAGKLAVANAPYVLDTLDTAIAMVQGGEAQAIVTAPVHKGVINDAGVAFSGHTEYLQERAGVDKVVMMLAGGGLRVALATTHLPLRAVPDAITAETLDQVLRILDADLRSRFGLARPRIAVCGLNPHAGEGGHLGREEIEVIAPAIARARAAGIDVRGPLPADTLFVPSHVAQFDAALAMFHDQGLPVLKHASFGRGVNITLGLPYVRTSVDHGTALDLAGTGKADPGSLQEAIVTALHMARASAAPGASSGASS